MPIRTCTLLFTDVVGSTAMSVAQLPHVADRARRLHFATLHAAVSSRGGIVVKTMGDGVMAVFDAADGAVTAATAAQRSVSVPIRIGISSGDVTMEDGDYFGVAVIEARRLCDHAAPGQTLVAESTRLLASQRGAFRPVGSVLLKGLSELTSTSELVDSCKSAVRVVVADDAVLVREGMVRLLEEVGIEVVAQASDARELLVVTDQLRPDVAIVDIRMPPTSTTEGLVAAQTILATHATTSVLLLSQDAEPAYAARLKRARATGVGYLLKERVTDIHQFASAVREVASGGSVFEHIMERDT